MTIASDYQTIADASVMHLSVSEPSVAAALHDLPLELLVEAAEDAENDPAFLARYFTIVQRCTAAGIPWRAPWWRAN